MFSENLKKLRKRANMSQVELSKLMNVNQYIISYWEKGRSEPSIKQIIKLSEIFKVPSDYLLGKEIIKVNNNDELDIVVRNMELDAKDEVNNKLISALNKLNEQQKKNLIDFIDSFIDNKL